MRIVIAPDKFKDSLTARQVCDAIESALLECDPSLIVQSFPMADGGEGTRALLTDFIGGSTITATVSDPLFRKIEAQYGVSGDGKTAVIEMAEASGLQLLAPNERNPLYTTSLGTGELIIHALNRGITNIILGLGGSATCDAGLGAGEALGFKYFAYKRKKLKSIGGSLQHLYHIGWNKKMAHPLLKVANCILLCDVQNPLHGVHGAAYTFAPQKGANAEGVQILDKGLQVIEAMLRKRPGMRTNYPGSGAAGGISVMLSTVMNTKMESGIKFITEFIGLENHIRDADVVITGEGNIDSQTFSGKVVHGIADLALKYRKPLFAIAGQCNQPKITLTMKGISEVVQLVNKDTSLQDAMENANSLLRARVRQELYPLIKKLQED